MLDHGANLDDKGIEEEKTIGCLSENNENKGIFSCITTYFLCPCKAYKLSEKTYLSRAKQTVCPFKRPTALSLTKDKSFRNLAIKTNDEVKKHQIQQRQVKNQQVKNQQPTNTSEYFYIGGESLFERDDFLDDLTEQEGVALLS